jgi:hypothetical protein
VAGIVLLTAHMFGRLWTYLATPRSGL